MTDRLVLCMGVIASVLVGPLAMSARAADHDDWRRGHHEWRREYSRAPDIYYSAPPVVSPPYAYYAQPPGVTFSLSIPTR